jgi:xanthine dehydrogenase accessory factor
MRAVLEDLLAELRRGRRAVLATIVRATGSTPRSTGARMVVRTDGTSSGSIGGGAFEAMIVADAREMLAKGEPPPEIRRYTFTEQGEDALGMACGGTAEVLLEVAGPGPRLVVFGAGHVGLAVARLAASVGFAPEIVDDREEFCDAARAAGVGRVFRCDAGYAAGVPELDPSCFVAVVTRCHATDRLALRRVLGGPLRYVGLIGSRRKKAVIFRELQERDGIAAEALEPVRCPIGLPIGGQTPEEIAVSIVAELMQVRSGAA